MEGTSRVDGERSPLSSITTRPVDPWNRVSRIRCNNCVCVRVCLHVSHRSKILTGSTDRGTMHSHGQDHDPEALTTTASIHQHRHQHQHQRPPSPSPSPSRIIIIHGRQAPTANRIKHTDSMHQPQAPTSVLSSLPWTRDVRAAAIAASHTAS